jgi:outer membrane protein insertion porin family
MLKQFQSVSSFLIFLSVWVFSFGDTKKIHSIDIKLQGPRTVSESFIRQNLQVEEGAIFRESSIDKSIRNLMDSGTIQDVKVYLDPDLENDEKVALVFKVKTKARVGEISFNGNDKISDKKLSKSISTKLGQMLDFSKVNADLKVLEDLYLEKGYWKIRIKSQVIDSTEEDEAKLVFEILENEKRKISKISFIGNANLKKDKLLDVMETAEWRFWRFWSARSKYRPRILEDDLEKLKEAYRNEGFLGVRLEQNNVRIIPYASKSLELQIEIIEGNRSFFGDNKITGNVVIDTEELIKKSMIIQGEPYSPEVLSNERSRLKRIYGEKGYLDAYVRVVRTPNLNTNQIDLRFEITENNKFSVNSIKVRGNEKTKTIVLLRELALAPGETFDLTRMDVDEGRLLNTKLFEKVSVTDEPIDTMDPELRNSRRNMVVDVEEGKTGHLGFGVGFSTLEKAMMFAEIRQGNFDIMRWRAPNFLQGDGQKFRLRLKLGSRSNEARLALEEPWFLNRRLAAGFELFREKSDFQSSYYDELRAGFEIYFRKRLFELVEGRLFYSYEDVLIDDVSLLAPKFIKEQDLVISKVGLTLSRDTRDALLFPTMGSVISMRKEFVGGIFGGDADYGRFEIQGTRFFQTYDAMEQVLTISGKFGTLGKFENGQDANVPFFDRFFMGGPYNLRGWDYREAGPLFAGSDEPEGGNSLSYTTLEYTFKLADPLRFAIFYDGGFLRRKDFKFTPGKRDEDWHDNWGLGLRIMVMGMPLRLDLGFPMTDPSGNGASTQFHFSGGTRF